MIPGIHFGATQSSLFAPLFLFFFLLLCRIFFTRNKALSLLKIKTIFLGHSKPKEQIRLILWTIMLGLAFIMVLRPQWSKREEKIPQQGRDLLILLDISRSMRATDIMPHRLDAAKLKIKQLLRLLTCERVGLILFSGSAFVQCPLTKDFAALDLFIDHVDIETISSGTTALDKALQASLDLFARTPERKNKLVLVVTDGEDFSTNFEAIIEKSKNENVRICTLGVGTEKGAPVPIFNEQGKQINVEKNPDGSIIFSKLNSHFLQELSEKLHGVYAEYQPDQRDLIAFKQFFESIEKESFEEEKLEQWEDQYHLFARLLFPLLLLEWFF